MDAPPHCANCGAPYAWTDRQNKISARAKRAAIGIGKKISVAYAEFLARVVDTSLGQTAIAIMLAAAALLLPSKITLVVAMVVAGLLLLRSAYRPGRLLRTLIVIGLALIFVSVVVWRNRELHTVPRPPATVLPSEKSSDEKDAAKTDVAKTETPKTEAKDVNKSDDTQAPPKRSQPKNPKTEKQVAPQTQINNAPNGIAIGGGTVNNPTVNNIVPRARVTASPQRQKQVGENWITEFVISSTDIVPTGIIRLTCDGVILGGGVRSSVAIMGTRHVGVDPSDPTTLVIDLTAPESISPNHPIAISVSAKTPVQIISGTIGGAKIEVPITNPVAVSAQQPTFTVTNPTGSIINQGTRVDAPQTVNNFAPGNRHLTPAQIDNLNKFVETLPDDTSSHLCFMTVPDAESQNYAYEIQQIFEKKGKTKQLVNGLSWHPTVPVGINVIISGDEKKPYFPLAKQISDGLGLSGLRVREFGGSVYTQPCGDIRVIVGTRPES